MPSTAIATELWTAVSSRYPWLKYPKMKVWADDIEKIHRIDGFEYDMIEAVMAWSQNDDFWRQQVRSGANLRRHFDRLLIQIKEGENGRARIFKI